MMRPLPFLTKATATASRCNRKKREQSEALSKAARNRQRNRSDAVARRCVTGCWPTLCTDPCAWWPVRCVHAVIRLFFCSLSRRWSGRSHAASSVCCDRPATVRGHPHEKLRSSVVPLEHATGKISTLQEGESPKPALLWPANNRSLVASRPAPSAPRFCRITLGRCYSRGGKPPYGQMSERSPCLKGK